MGLWYKYQFVYSVPQRSMCPCSFVYKSGNEALGQGTVPGGWAGQFSGGTLPGPPDTAIHLQKVKRRTFSVKPAVFSCLSAAPS